MKPTATATVYVVQGLSQNITVDPCNADAVVAHNNGALIVRGTEETRVYAAGQWLQAVVQ